MAAKVTASCQPLARGDNLWGNLYASDSCSRGYWPDLYHVRSGAGLQALHARAICPGIRELQHGGRRVHASAEPTMVRQESAALHGSEGQEEVIMAASVELHW